MLTGCEGVRVLTGCGGVRMLTGCENADEGIEERYEGNKVDSYMLLPHIDSYMLIPHR